MNLISKRVLLTLVTVTVFVLMGSVKSSHEFQITINPHDQVNPAIYKDIVVYEDNSNGNWDIYGYNLSTKEEFQITDNLQDQNCPAIYNDIVVWEDKRYYYTNIFGYNLTTGQEFRITTRAGYQLNPAIYKDIVVWEDDRNGKWDIYGFHLETKEEFQITDDPQKQKNPHIFEDMVVWEEKKENGSDAIYGYNIETQEQFKISNTKENFCYISLYEDTVVWLDEIFYLKSCLYSYDLSTKKQIRILWQNYLYGATIYDNIIVWAALTYDGTHICGYNLDTSEKLQIATSPTRKGSPAIYNDIVVWAEERNNNRDIYGCSLKSVPTEPLSRSKILILMDYIPLSIFYSLLTILTFMGSYIAVRIIGKSEPIKEESKDFRFSNLDYRYPLILSIIFALVGFLLVYRGLLMGFTFPVYILISFISYAWIKRTPYYLRVTHDKVIIYPPDMPHQVIPWDTIKDIKFLPWKNKIELLRLNGESVDIDLTQIDRMDRANVASLLSVRFSKVNPPE